MIDWKEVEILIKNTKNSLTLLLSLLINYKQISKDNFNFLIRIYIRFHYKTLLQYPVIKLFNTLKIEVNSNISKFYKFYIKLAKLINNVIIVKEKFNKYKKLTIMEFTEKINKENQIFKAHFDSSFANTNFQSKLMHYFFNDKLNKTIEYEISKRLQLSLKVIGFDFVKHFEINILYLEEYNNLSGFDKFKFINEFYEKVVNTYKVINLNLKKIQIYKDILENLSKPKKINITINNTLNSETDNEDIDIFII
tara:strand:- start:3684 stop:4439 length:756 start_codon:yes stop_codon:yes gene_type:complete